MTDHRSPRVNKAQMANYIGQTVRLIAKIITIKNDVAIVQTSDKAEVEVKVLRDFDSGSQFLEIIGQVESERRIKMQGYINMGDNVDMDLANHVVLVWHDPKFASVF